MGFYFDPSYWLVIGVGLLLSLWASVRVKGTFHQFSQVGTRAGLTGAEVARLILQRSGIDDVRIEPVPGAMTDHYDPRTKTLRLSEPVFASRSIAACGVAAHEVGHAIQHAHGYAPLKFRSAWVPMANTGGTLSLIVLILAATLGGFHRAGVGSTLATVGLALFGCTTLFTLVTLPVEFDASRRALVSLEGTYLSPQEMEGARKVLNAAALTYVAAFVTSLLTLLYWAARLGLFGGRSSDN